jgi:acetyl esterase/lipase
MDQQVQDRLDPEIATILAALPAMEWTAGGLAGRRSAPVPSPELSSEVERRDFVVPGNDPAEKLTLRVHRPVGVTSPLPALYWMHGGGYVVGSYAGEDARFDRWCRRLRLVGISVEYRLAPEHPYPAPIEDCYAGLLWVFAHADELLVDAHRVGIGGSSAGGGLAAALALMARDRGQVEPAFQLLNCPMLDDRQVTASSRRDTPVWNPQANQFGWSSYLGPLYGGSEIPAYAAPARAEDLAGLPPALVSVGTVDGFFDEDVAYAERLNRAGVPTELAVWPGAPHGFEAVAPNSALAQRSGRRAEEWLGRQIRR